MKLGAYSISLNVKDIAESRAFYEKLGFVASGGNADQGWLILRNADVTIGLFQGMFDQNIMTFNPGWDQNAEALSDFTDIRDIQKQLKVAGVDIDTAITEGSEGPASFIIHDPDGNPILIDQHV